MQIKYSILKILWNMNKSWLESSFSSSSIPNRSWRDILEQSRYYISLCLLLSSPSLMFFFNRIHFSQLSYCSLIATLRKKIYRSQWTPSTRFIIEEFTGILLQHCSRKEFFWKRRPELSHTLQALYHSCRVLSLLYLGPSFQLRYRESREVYKRAKRRVGEDGE